MYANKIILMLKKKEKQSVLTMGYGSPCSLITIKLRVIYATNLKKASNGGYFPQR